MDTQNDGLEKVDSFKNIAIFGIYVRFLECKWLFQLDSKSLHNEYGCLEFFRQKSRFPTLMYSNKGG